MYPFLKAFWRNTSNMPKMAQVFSEVTATKAFGLLEGRGSYSLTDLAKQYFYPTVENGREAAAVKSLTFPKAFSLLVQKFDGGKLPS